MEFLKEALDWFLHLDHHLGELIAEYGVWTYGILSAIIFAETGLVVMPLLPGDSLLFTAGTLAARGSLNVHLLSLLLFLAAVVGDTVNYHLGLWFGKGISKSRFVKKEYLDRAHSFYEKHGGKAVVFARFLPIVRTFVPFVAGIARMSYGKFFMYNVIGAFAWIALFCYGGYFFGNIPAIKNNFTLVILAIIVISAIPALVEAIRMRQASAMDKNKNQKTAASKKVASKKSKKAVTSKKARR